MIRKSIGDECQTILHPPVSIVGIPAMKKVAREIASWPEKLGEDTTVKCLQQVREYLNSPPDLGGDHLTDGWDLYIRFMEEAGAMAGLDFTEAISRLRESIAAIPELAEAIRQSRLEDAASHFHSITEIEMEAYACLSKIVDATGLSMAG